MCSGSLPKSHEIPRRILAALHLAVNDTGILSIAIYMMNLQNVSHSQTRNSTLQTSVTNPAFVRVG